ncbi:MAG: hypothetical protein RLN88_08125 [Ekhidna sp.]|uniref:hypothetical protein n=1 Tax=Ekhidna sp. TaxID=2608089 RepID=UPI0032EEBFF5
MKEVKILEEANVDEKNKYEESIKAFADKLEERIDYLKGKASDVETSAKESYHKKIDQLKEKKEEFLRQYENIKETSEGKWEEIKGEVSLKVDKIKGETETAYTGIRSGFSYLFDKFKN